MFGKKTFLAFLVFIGTQFCLTIDLSRQAWAGFCLCTRQDAATGQYIGHACSGGTSVTTCTQSECDTWGSYILQAGIHATYSDCEQAFDELKKAATPTTPPVDTGTKTCLFIIRNQRTLNIRHECKLRNGQTCAEITPSLIDGDEKIDATHREYDDPAQCEAKFTDAMEDITCISNKTGTCVNITVTKSKARTMVPNPSDPEIFTYLQCFSGSNRQTDCAKAQESTAKCCMYKNNADSYTCECGDGVLYGDGTCKSSSGSGAYYNGPYASKTDCEDARPGELPKFKVDEPTEQLSHETLEKMNPLRHSLPNVFGNQSNRNPGYIISRLVKNIIFPISGLILFIQIIWAGFQVVQGGTTGNDNQVNSGKQRLISVIVGFLLLFASYWLWSLVE
ncbi:hypothetical protein IJJ08_04765, partial [bacterium]|nr:hypothetical protein [bacterium]